MSTSNEEHEDRVIRILREAEAKEKRTYAEALGLRVLNMSEAEAIRWRDERKKQRRQMFEELMLCDAKQRRTKSNRSGSAKMTNRHS